MSCRAVLNISLFYNIFSQNSALHIYGIQSTAFSTGEDAVSVNVAVKVNT